MERAVTGGPHAPDPSAHAAGCADCAAFVRSAERCARAVATLDRLPAPAELSGRVVAACNAGYLQERAASALRSLGRVEVPEALEQKVLGPDPGRLQAPSVLEHLVDADLRDPSQALVRRFAGRLQRLDAPPELARRVAADLARPRSIVRRSRLPLWGIVAIGTLFAGGVIASLWTRRSVTPSESRLAFRIERVHDVNELGPEARDLLAGLSGGWSEVPWESAR
jgi:hypothetical protein